MDAELKGADIGAHRESLEMFPKEAVQRTFFGKKMLRNARWYILVLG